MSDTIPEEQLEHAVTVLQNTGIIVFPTESSYGLGCDFQNQAAIQRILKVKGRRKDTKFTLVAASLEQVQQFFDLSAKAIELAKHYWPGPLSIVVNDQFSVRVPSHEIPRQLAEAYGKPLIATSANKTGQPSLYTLEDVQDELGGRNVDLWINGGELSEQLPSTVVRVSESQVEIIRAGALTIPTT